MGDKPSFRDFFRSIKTMDRPYVYENSKTKKIYTESNAASLQLGFSIIIIGIPIILYAIYFVVDINEYTHSKLCIAGLVAYAIVIIVLSLLRYPLIKFKEIKDIEEVEKKRLRLADVIPNIIWFAAMWHFSFNLF